MAPSNAAPFVAETNSCTSNIQPDVTLSCNYYLCSVLVSQLIVNDIRLSASN